MWFKLNMLECPCTQYIYMLKLKDDKRIINSFGIGDKQEHQN